MAKKKVTAKTKQTTDDTPTVEVSTSLHGGQPNPTLTSGRVPARADNSIFSVPLILIFLIVPIISLLWTSEAPGRPFALVKSKTTSAAPVLIQPRVLLVTAHPDDELLFTPTILSLLSEEKQKDASLWAMCLTAGDYEEAIQGYKGQPLAEVRRQEWAKSWDILGLDESRRWILDVPTLKDNASVEWNANAVAEQLMPYVIKHDINVILTFDQGGVTGHANHKAIPHGVSHMLSMSAFKTSLKGKLSPRLFTLKTESWRSQYGLFSPIIEHLYLGVSVLYQQMRAENGGSSSPGTPPALDEMPNTVFISDVKRYVKAWRALLAHESSLDAVLVAMALAGKYFWVNEWVAVML